MYSNNIYPVFLTVLQMSIIASVAIIIVLVFRQLMKIFPKILTYLLWGIVLFRLLCPVSFSSSFSIFKLSNLPFISGLFQEENAAQGVLSHEETIDYVILDEVTVLPSENVTATHTMEDGEIKEEISHTYYPTEITEPPVREWLFPAIWMIGMGAVLGYGICSYFSLKKKLVGAVEEEKGIYSCDYIQTAFVLGIFSPKIYIPSNLEESQKEFILLHEKTHMKRGDSFFRLLAYPALALHWFNPLVWIAYHMSGIDMELACDEAVMRKAEKDIRKEYAASLLEIASGKHTLFAGFPAFGENQTKERIKSIVNYKKKSIAKIIAGSAIVVILIIVLAANPKEETPRTATTYSDEEVVHGMAEAFDSAKIEEWAKAFCNRDGDKIIEMSTPEARKVFEDGMLLVQGAEPPSFGWSSPWPFMETDYTIKLLEENRATILYYARTSDPHVTVWAEHLEFERSENLEAEDDFKVTNSEILFLDSIDNAAEFVLAYEEGINNTPMDYLTNGLGEALNRNAIENKDSVWYDKLFSPETAAITLLNLDSQIVPIDISEGETEEEVILTLMFQGQESESIGVLQNIKMIQPFGKDGIWIPQDYTDTVSLEQPENYFNNYEYYKEELGEDFLEEYYEKVFTVDSDISRDGIDETIEVYTGNIGDGDSGYVMIKDIHGNLLFHEFAHRARAGWNMVFFSEDNFLMNVSMDDRETYGEYSYEVYRVLGKDEIQILAQDSFSFDTEREVLDEQELITFMDTLNRYLEESQLLLSTQEGELKAVGLSEEELTLENVTADWYLWRKIWQNTN